MIRSVLLCVSFWVTGSAAGAAPFIVPCRQDDSACILKSAKIALPHVIAGLEQFGMTPMDPFPVNDVSANSGDLKLALKNLVVTGLSKCTFNKIERKAKGSSLVLDVDCPVKIAGDYVASGKLAFIDIFGNGPMKISGGIMNINLDVKLKTITNSGVKYYKVSGYNVKYKPKSKFTLLFENLYGGDKKRAKPIEDILDQSSDKLIVDFGKPVIDKVILDCVGNINKLFTNLPAEEIELV